MDSDKKIMKAVFGGIIVLFAAILIVPAFFYAFSVDGADIASAVAAVAYFDALGVGIRSSYGISRMGYRNGLAAGAIFGLLYFIAASVLNGGDLPGHFIKLLIIIVISTVGGIIGINLKRRR
jgi:putative membrane protein (TIGR04086 family)